ncbi:LPS translocon maturation chaperone LptM [Piscinibacter sakaiensis]|uniref:LPS translocon maturation chaperone LptM n=1 Tax=Piscinibacter sakaiensis TaxID=1547922 RepID=UPI003AAD36FD
MHIQPHSVARQAINGLASGRAGGEVAGRWLRRIAATCCSALLIACGQKGPLTMPQPISPPGGAAAASAASAASAPAAAANR